MANNTNCPEVLARLILKNHLDKDEYACGVGAIGYICPNGTNPDGGMDPAEGEMLSAEEQELKAEWLELTGNEWTWKDLEAAWTVCERLTIEKVQREKRQKMRQVGTLPLHDKGWDGWKDMVSEEEMESISEGESMARAIEEGELRSIRASENNPPARLGGSRNRFGQMEWF